MSTSPMVWVHMDGPTGVRLELDLDSVHHDDWEMVCVAPCDAHVDTAFNYRVTGGLMKASNDFSLRAAGDEHERLHVDGASKLWFVLGWIGIGAGSASASLGLIGVALGPVLNSLSDRPQPSSERTADWAALGVGAAVVVGGLILILSNRRTTVSQDVVAPRTGFYPSNIVPTWREEAPWRYGTAPTTGVQVFSGRF